jgi:hypothetical protein
MLWEGESTIYNLKKQKESLLKLYISSEVDKLKKNSVPFNLQANCTN